MTQREFERRVRDVMRKYEEKLRRVRSEEYELRTIVIPRRRIDSYVRPRYERTVLVKVRR